jgi:hypothetical protein
MADEVETMLEGLERRLRALQLELDEPEEPAPVPTRPPDPADPLDEFGHDLRRLVASFDRIVAELRGPPTAAGYVFTGDVAIDAVVDFGRLCALGRALEQIGGVASVDLRAYAGGRAALDVTLRRPLALVEELRRTMRLPVALIEAREGRLAIEVGSVGRSGPESGP